jgi:hydroxymethylglutaryl-CoA reductase
MALYSELPVFKKAYDLLLEVYLVHRDLPKSVKYTIGEKLQQEVLEMIIEIYKANSRTDKISAIQSAREHVEITRLLIRVLFDIKLMGIKRMVMINTMIEEVSKQLAGWQRHSEKN